MPEDVAVVAYFADDPSRVYQLEQWLPVLELLDAHQPVAVVLRDRRSRPRVQAATRLSVLVAESLTDLTDLYDRLDPKLALYCNNSPLNFNSLISNRMLHVHVSHGESDKQSMASNCAKAYDRVFVAGPAAVDRYVGELMEIDPSRLVRVGRPQLDLPREPVIPPWSGPTVLYAPTWEGDAEYNDYTSLDTLGRSVVTAAVGLPGVRVVYKPHPKVLTSTTPRVREAHADVVALLAESEHLVLDDADVLAVMPSCDAMVADVSSVGPDWLYLRTDRPLFVTDRRRDRERLHRETPLSTCADVLDEPDVPAIAELLAARLAHDEHRSAREEMRRYYFDELEPGDSTARFQDSVADLVRLRDRLLALRPVAG